MTATADLVVTSARSGLTPTQWSSDFFTEYLRENQFSKYFGTSENSMIQVREDLARKPGDSIVFAYLNQLAGAGVTGATALEGAEDSLDLRSMKVSVDTIRNAVAVNELDEQKSVVDLLAAARPALMNWAKAKMRSDIITALGQITGAAAALYSYSAANAAQRNAHLVANADRTQFGASVSNAVSGVYATAMATIDGTNDKLTAATLALAKRRARTADPHIRPIRVNNDEEWYVVFTGALAFRDLMKDTTITAAMQYAWERGQNNPLFTAGDILYDGMIIREIPEIAVIADVGDSATVDVSPTYICGAQAIGVAYAQRTKAISALRDYGYVKGVGVQEIRGIAKLRFGTDASVDLTSPKDTGVYTLWTAAEPDA